MWPSEIQQIPSPTIVSQPTPDISTPITPVIRFMRLPQVTERTTLCRSAILALEGFPKAVRLGPTRARAWVESEVIEWMEQQIAARNNHIAGEL